MKEVLKAFHNSSSDTSQFLSAHLRQEARKSGWPEHVVNNMHVTYDGKSFNTHIHDEHHSEALDYEYGTPDRRPTAAIRRFNNRTAESEKFFLSRFKSHLKGIL